MQQMRETFPWDHGCRYLLRDRDAIYGADLVASISSRSRGCRHADNVFGNHRRSTLRRYQRDHEGSVQGHWEAKSALSGFALWP
jgi:hypothetical protein